MIKKVQKHTSWWRCFLINSSVLPHAASLNCCFAQYTSVSKFDQMTKAEVRWWLATCRPGSWGWKKQQLASSDHRWERRIANNESCHEWVNEWFGNSPHFNCKTMRLWVNKDHLESNFHQLNQFSTALNSSTRSTVPLHRLPSPRISPVVTLFHTHPTCYLSTFHYHHINMERTM